MPGFGHWAILALHRSAPALSLIWDLIFSAQMHSCGQQRYQPKRLIPCMEVCMCKGSERCYNMRASLKGLGMKVENTKLPLLSYFIKIICIVSFSWFFFPHEIFPWLGTGSRGSSWFCWGVLLCSPLAGAPPRSTAAVGQPSLPLLHAGFSSGTPSGRRLPGRGKKR